MELGSTAASFVDTDLDAVTVLVGGAVGGLLDMLERQAVSRITIMVMISKVVFSLTECLFHNLS